MIIPENKLAFFTSLLDGAREGAYEKEELFSSAFKQYKGEAVSLGHPYAATRNITYELIESEVSTDIPAPKVSPSKEGEKSRRNARRIEALLGGLRDRLPFEKLNDADERMTYVYGASLFLLEWDEASREDGEQGGVRLSQISPTAFLPQPNVNALDDMEYFFLFFTSGKDGLMRTYQLSEAALDSLSEGDTVEVTVCFYKNEKGQISRFVFAEDIVLSDIEDIYARKRVICKDCREDASLCRCGGKQMLVSEELEYTEEEILLASGEVIPKGSAIRRYRPKRYPLVIRKNTSFEESLFGQSDVSFIRPQQEEINKTLSRLHEKLMMAGLYPYKPDGCQFRYDNSIGGKVLSLRPGESPNMFGVLDTTPDIAKDLAYIEATYRDAKRILGISDAFVGESESGSVSGKSRSIQVAQAEGRLASKRVMKNAAYAELDRLIFEFYLAYADEPRAVVCRDSFYRASKDDFSRYDFLIKGKDGIWEYDDGYRFSVDLEKPSREEREKLWQYNLDNYCAGGFGALGERESLARYWAAQVAAAYPGAKKNLSYFLET